MNSSTLMMISRLIILLTAIPIHEAAHAWASDKLGDPTARLNGRLTLNPLVHFDFIGSLCLIMSGIGWAKPVPINPRYYENRKAGMALSAVAGPLANMFLAYLAMILSKLALWSYLSTNIQLLYHVYTVFYFMTIINISLGIFNLLPMPPFDGSRILLVVLPERVYFKLMQYEQYLMIGFFVLLMMGFFDAPLNFLDQAMYNMFDRATSFIDLIGSQLI